MPDIYFIDVDSERLLANLAADDRQCRDWTPAHIRALLLSWGWVEFGGGRWACEEIDLFALDKTEYRLHHVE